MIGDKLALSERLNKYLDRDNILVHTILLSLLLISSSCVEPYDISGFDFEKVLVVDARFTNEQTAHYVKLNYTRDPKDYKSEPLSGADVWITDNDGSEIVFEESEPGIYLTDSSVAGVAGKEYQLSISISEGQLYQSKKVKLLPSPPIDSIYTSYEERIVSDAEGIRRGIQFFLDTHDETGQVRYLKYEWEETYEVRAPYPALYRYESSSDSAIFLEEQVNVCYAKGQSSQIILASSANLSEPKLSGVDIRYISDQTDQLKYAYSLLATQYAIDVEAYNFYREVVENNESTGSLFGKQLGAIIGNITNTENQEEIVLGYFEVSGVTRKRVFIRYEDLDGRFNWPQDRYSCSGSMIKSISDRDSLVYYTNGLGMGILNAQYCDSVNNPTMCPFVFKADLAPRYCTDCRFRGPSVKPEFWIY